MVNIDLQLQPYQRFGVNLGLDRLKILLDQLGNPHESVPIIHVGGTNGKGSVCAYLSSVLKEAGYQVGRYTSPHLVDWTERIQINQNPIPPSEFIDLLQEIQPLIESSEDPPTLFEIVTTIAWLYFKRSQVDIAIMEVGLGGRLDATNVGGHPLVSVITSISREHWQVLGDTLTEIATEKAGIIKPHCPVVIGQVPTEAQLVFQSKIEALKCPSTWVSSARQINENLVVYNDIEYNLPLLGDIQLMNSAIAIAVLQHLQQQGWQISTQMIQAGISKTQWLGRLQWINFENHSILMDGAHNAAAAQGLAQYVHSLNRPVTWLIGMLSTKDHLEILKTLLRKNDYLYLVPVPDHSSALPEDLAQLVQKLPFELTEIKIFTDVFLALQQAITIHPQRLTVICGSLYLVGYFLRHYQQK